MPAGVEVPANWHPYIVIVASLIVAAMMVGSYIKQWTKDASGAMKASNTEAMVVGGALADRAGLTRVSEVLERIADLMEESLNAKKDEQKHNELVRVHERMDEIMKKIATL